MNIVRESSAGRSRFTILLACTTGNFVGMTPAVTVPLSLFLVPIAEEFAWPRARVTGVITLLALIASIVVPFAGRLADRFGARRIILIGHVAFAVSLLLLLLANGSTVQFYLIFLVIGVAGAVPTQSLYSKVIAEWYDRNRALCLAIAGGVGSAGGSIVMPIAAAAMYAQLGWRGAFAGMGLLVLAIGSPILFTFLRDAPRQRDAVVTGGDSTDASLAEAMRSRIFWIVLVAFILGAGCLTAVFTHIVPLLMDRAVSMASATAVLSVTGLTCASWQIMVGYTLDRSRTPQVLIPMFLVAVAGLGLLEFAATMPLLLLGGAMVGIGLGSEYGGLPYILSRYFGLRAYGAIVGLVFGAVTLAQGVIPFLFDAIFDHFGSYRVAIWAVAASLAVGAALILVLPPFSRAREQ
ncbi:MAG: major facilitator superfamily 1 [Bradyrhizobium sp.]|nr:major facilitator superfamily 1 [Bradyrhizobium sp.]